MYEIFIIILFTLPIWVVGTLFVIFTTSLVPSRMLELVGLPTLMVSFVIPVDFPLSKVGFPLLKIKGINELTLTLLPKVEIKKN